MRKFSFRLESIRRLREQEEHAVQTELAGALRDRARLEADLVASQAAEQAIYDYLRQNQLSGAEMAHVADYGTLHRRRILDARIMLQQADERIGRVRERLAEARARREALERLCERDREQHRQEWLAEQMRELDEVASMRARRPGVRLVSAEIDARGAA